MSQAFEIHTSCGKVFTETLEEMSDWQLLGLFEQNQDSEDIHLLEGELRRRGLLLGVDETNTPLS